MPLYDRGEWQALHRLAVLTHQPLEKVVELRVEGPIPGGAGDGDGGGAGGSAAAASGHPAGGAGAGGGDGGVGVAEADLYPKLSLTGAFNLQSALVEDLFNWRSRMFSLGPAISWPIFESGRLHAVVAVRNAQQGRPWWRTSRRCRGRSGGAGSDGDVCHGAAAAESLAEAVTSDRDALDLATKLYAQGLTDFLTVLDAQRQVDQAENGAGAERGGGG